jgi:hypothetical protein
MKRLGSQEYLNILDPRHWELVRLRVYNGLDGAKGKAPDIEKYYKHRQSKV